MLLSHVQSVKMFLICQVKVTEMIEQIHFHMATGLKVLAFKVNKSQCDQANMTQRIR